MSKLRTHVLDLHLGDTGECLTFCGRKLMWIDDHVVATSASDSADCRLCEKEVARRKLVLSNVQARLGEALTAKYYGYIETGIRARQLPNVIERAVRSLEHQATEIDAGRCPKCGKPIKRYGPQESRRLRASAGLSPVSMRPAPVGEWVMYRCSTQKPPGTYDPDAPCRFMLDRFEAGEAN